MYLQFRVKYNNFKMGLVMSKHRIFYAETEEVLNDLRIFRISAFLVTELGVFPYLFGALGLPVKGAKILTISVCPEHAAL